MSVKSGYAKAADMNMISSEWWEQYEFTLEPGTLIYCIDEDDELLGTDFIRSEFCSTRWIRLKDRMPALVGKTIKEINECFKGTLITPEVMREYL